MTVQELTQAITQVNQDKPAVVTNEGDEWRIQMVDHGLQHVVLLHLHQYTCNPIDDLFPGKHMPVRTLAELLQHAKRDAPVRLMDEYEVVYKLASVEDNNFGEPSLILELGEDIATLEGYL